MNISKFIPKQIHIPYVGALWTLSGIVLTLVNAVSFLFQTRLYYYNQDDSLLKDVFGSYVVYMVAFVLLGVIMLALAYAVILPALNSFQQAQAVKDGRSPTYEKLCEVADRQKSMDERLKVIEKKF
jgi:hypothetical protein